MATALNKESGDDESPGSGVFPQNKQQRNSPVGPSDECARDKERDRERERDRRSSRTPRRTRSVSPRSYTKSIIAHSRRTIGSCIFPGQNYIELAQWLQLPDPQQTLKQSIYREPHCLIVLHTLGVQGQGRTQYLQSDDLGAFRQLPRPDVGKSGQLLFIRGYLAADWVTTIGAKYHIDPEFFNWHLRFLSRSFPGAIFNRHTLPSSTENVVRLRITTIFHRNDLTVLRRDDNVQERRRVEAEAMEVYFRQFPIQSICGDSIVRAYATLDSEISMLEQEISIFLRKTNEGWMAIVWSDVGRDLAGSFAGPWNLHGLDRTINMQPLPIFQYHPKMTLRQTAVERLISAPKTDHPMSGYTHRTRIPQTTAVLPFDFDTFLDDEIAKNNALYALTNLFQHALSSELQVVSLLEWQIRRAIDLVGGQHHPHLHKRQTDHPLDNLLYLRNLLNTHITYIRETLRTLQSPGNDSWFAEQNQSPGTIQTLTRLITDHETLLTTALTLDRHCSDGIGIMMNRAVISESHKAIEQAERMKKLTMLASFFIPLSFTCSLFGMNFREFGQGTLSIWLFWVVTVPILGLTWVFYVWDIAEAARGFGAWVKGGWRGRTNAHMDSGIH